jgi:hypothetical protein
VQGFSGSGALKEGASVRTSIINRIGLATIAGCVAVGALPFAGCGGSSSSSTTVASGASGAAGTAPLSQDEFVSQANAICKETNDKIVGVNAAQSNSLSDLSAMVQDEIPINNEAYAKFAALTPPSDLQAKYNELLSGAKAQEALANQFVDAAKTNDVNQANAILDKAKTLSSRQDSLSKSMGLTECAKDVSPQG